MRAFEALTRAGFKVNLRKCKLLVHSCTLLGCIVSASQLALGDKYLHGLAGLDIPTNWRQLQSVLGKLLWAAPFIPTYKRIVAPIEGLLACRGSVRWLLECTAALNELASIIFLRLRVSMPQEDQPFKLYPDFDHQVSMAVLT